MAIGGLAVFLEEGQDVLGIFDDTRLITVIAVDKDDEMRGLELDLGAFVVAGRRPYPTLCIAIDG